jgi:hypothetical protein
MAGLLDIFGTSGADTMGLLGMSPADIQRNRDDAQAQALYALAGRLFQGGNTGASIAQGLQQGQQAYKGAMQGALQEQLQNAQLQEMIKKRKEEELAKQQQLQAQQVLSKAYRPEIFADTPLTNIMGQQIAGPNQPQAAGGGLRSVTRELMALGPAGMSALQTASGVEKALRPEGYTLGENQVRYEIGADGKPMAVATGAPKPEQNLTNDYKNWVLAGKPKTFGAWLEESKKPLVVMTEGQKGFENTTDLKKQFGGEPIYKEFAGMQTAYSQVTSAIKQGTPIGDTAAATKIMKLLDPGSVVRETELGMAMAATGKMDRLKNYMDLYISGKKLTDSQRVEFQSLADQLYNAAATAYNSKRGEYERIGKGFKLNTDLALGEPAKVVGGESDLASLAKAELARRQKNKESQ